jgi:integrase
MRTASTDCHPPYPRADNCRRSPASPLGLRSHACTSASISSSEAHGFSRRMRCRYIRTPASHRSKTTRNFSTSAAAINSIVDGVEPSRHAWTRCAAAWYHSHACGIETWHPGGLTGQEQFGSGQSQPALLEHASRSHAGCLLTLPARARLGRTRPRPPELHQPCLSRPGPRAREGRRCHVLCAASASPMKRSPSREARCILAAAATRRNGPRWSVALAVGVRQSEALGLCWQHVDLDAGTIAVGWQLKRGALPARLRRPRHLRGKADIPFNKLVEWIEFRDRNNRIWRRYWERRYSRKVLRYPSFHIFLQFLRRTREVRSACRALSEPR